MNEHSIKKTSKFLSLILRHSPETIHLSLDENGWADVMDLIKLCNKHQHKLDLEQLQYIVNSNDKKRFAFNEDQTKIRASQGHSIAINLGLNISTAPDTLFHGTVDRFLNHIKLEGLLKMNRQHVHLSQELETAIKVGNRRGQAIILTIQSGIMQQDGFQFYLSDNGVWLTECVPPQYIIF